MSAPPLPLAVPTEPLLPGSVEQYLVANVPLCSPDTPLEAVRTMLLGRTFDSAVDIAVVEQDGSGPHHLVGLLPVETVLAAAAGTTARDLMDDDPPVVAPGLDQEKAAWKATRHGESSLAVVDAQGRFLGLVPPARLLSVLLRAHDRDLTRLGGFLRSSRAARHAMDEPVPARLWHRLPWLLLGLAGSAGAAALVRGFEADLTSQLALAFFMPGIVYMADAVGTQTEALVIRGLSVGVPIRRVFRLETLTGLLVGVLLGVVTLPAVWLTTGSAGLGITVATSLLAACAVATVVAMSLPWLMTLLHRDPAFGSGPLATVVQDLLSLVIYFLVAAAVLG